MTCSLIIAGLLLLHGPAEAKQAFVGGTCADRDPNKDCITARKMSDYWPSPPVGTFILTNYVQPDGTSCAKHDRYRVGTYPGGTSYVMDEYDCAGGSDVFLGIWYYQFGPSDVSEWRDDVLTDRLYKVFETGKEITWGGNLTPGGWSGKQTHCVEGSCGDSYAWGWSQIRLNYTFRDFPLNGTTYHDVVYVAQQQALCCNSDCSSISYINGGYYLIPTSGGGGYGGFIKQEYYVGSNGACIAPGTDSWVLSGHHDVSRTCVTSDFNQLVCP